MGRVEDPLPARTAEGYPVHRQPAQVWDNRFAYQRTKRWVYCDRCGKVCNHEYKGDFFLAAQKHYHDYYKLSKEKHMFALPMPACVRYKLWDEGRFDARWYCIACYSHQWHMDPKDVAEIFGFTTRLNIRRAYYEQKTMST